MRAKRIAFFADNHLGYSAYSRTDESGINLRVADGYKALAEITNQVIKEHKQTPIDFVVHGGDFFHTSHPSIRDIMNAQHYLRQFAKHKIPFYGLAGNHDASDNRASIAAVGVLNDPERGINALYHPTEKWNVDDGILLHAVAHHGHRGEEVQVAPEDGKINIFTTHGAAVDPKNATLMRCQNSPREQIVSPELIQEPLFDLKLLGHYHSRYEVGKGANLKTWYAGSTLRRGFSDEKGDRGWLLITLYEDGSSDVEFRNIWQRPQHDLPLIDATDKSASELQDTILENISTTRLGDSLNFDPAHAPILRQRVMGIDRHTREGIDQFLLARQASHALQWKLEFMRPNLTTDKSPALSQEEEEAIEESLSLPSLSRKAEKGSINIESQYLEWASQSKTLRSLSTTESREKVGEEGQRHLKSAEEKEAEKA